MGKSNFKVNQQIEWIEKFLRCLLFVSSHTNTYTKQPYDGVFASI